MSIVAHELEAYVAGSPRDVGAITVCRGPDPWDAGWRPVPGTAHQDITEGGDG
jgi:hypothetical protein